MTRTRPETAGFGFISFLIQSNCVTQSESACAAKQSRSCSRVTFSSASGAGSASWEKYARSVVSEFSVNSPPSGVQRKKSFTTP